MKHIKLFNEFSINEHIPAPPIFSKRKNKAIVDKNCKNCGANSFLSKDGITSCEHCGTTIDSDIENKLELPELHIIGGEIDLNKNPNTKRQAPSL